MNTFLDLNIDIWKDYKNTGREEWGFFSITCLVNAKTNDKELQGTVDITRCLDTVVEHYVTNVQLIWNFMCESTTCQVF